MMLQGEKQVNEGLIARPAGTKNGLTNRYYKLAIT
jgi:hypothetical protein